MVQVIVVLAIVVVAVLVGLVLRHRRAVAAPTQPRQLVPAQLDRADFSAPTPWLVAVFSAASCATCGDVVRKARVLQSADVTVIDVEFGAAQGLHTKDDIPAVPIVAGFAGPVTATDLWAAAAEARQPGTSPEPDLGR